MSFIQVQDVHKSFKHTSVLNGISFSFPKGAQVVLVGASGSGKSTLLYLLGGLDRPDKGSIQVGGDDLGLLGDAELAAYRNQKVGFIFQFHFLLPSMNCLDNMLLPSRISEHDHSEVQKWVLHLADTLGVGHCLAKFPSQLSGGEQQRVNIIRALSLKPPVLLCDEPTGNLDSQNSQIVMNTLKNLSSEINSTLMVVTHDHKIANSFSDKISIEDGHIIS